MLSTSENILVSDESQYGGGKSLTKMLKKNKALA